MTFIFSTCCDSWRQIDIGAMVVVGCILFHTCYTQVLVICQCAGALEEIPNMLMKDFPRVLTIFV